MNDILFLVIAVALALLVMVPVVAEGIHHTEFKKREPLIRATLAVNELARKMQAFSAAAVLGITATFEQFARMVAAHDQKRGH